MHRAGNEATTRACRAEGSTTDNGVAGPTLLAPGPAVSLSTEMSFAPNCSKVAARVAHRLLALAAGSLGMGSPPPFLFNAFHRY